MEIEIQSQRNNPLMNRTEVQFIIHHDGEATPRRELVRTELAEQLKTKKDHVIVDHMNSEFGIHKTFGYAKVYTSLEKAKTGERAYIMKRNTGGGGDGKEEPSKERSKEATKDVTTDTTTSEEEKKEKPMDASTEKPEESKEEKQEEKSSSEPTEEKKE